MTILSYQHWNTHRQRGTLYTTLLPLSTTSHHLPPFYPTLSPFASEVFVFFMFCDFCTRVFPVISRHYFFNTKYRVIVSYRNTIPVLISAFFNNFIQIIRQILLYPVHHFYRSPADSVKDVYTKKEGALYSFLFTI